VNRERLRRPCRPLAGGAQWYKDAIIYEVPVRAFADSNGDGVGDFRGLVERLDYLQDLGVTALWLLPFYPSPLRDDGYDIADYTAIHPRYGTLADFKLFLREAHRRGLRVITELVVNHTSDQHPWFQRARRAPAGDPLRDFYVWSDTPEAFRDARIIFKDFETSNWTWDPVAGAYYWHRFYSHQPDLNFDNPKVWEAVFAAMDFWLEMGIDGLRLDAIPYLYEREGTNCENLPETHGFLRALRRHVDEKFADRMLLAEANQWPEDAAAYFGKGDECHMAFHFPVMPRLFMAIRMEDRLPILDILQQTPPIPPACQWALFLRNHDELTLEMVTDEDRDYMYRVYARDPQARLNLGIRRRLAPLLDNHRAKIELMNGLLFSLPGTPVLYYGDEVGMGDNIYLGDRNGVRTPMQWNGDRNAGFSHANPQSLYLPLIIDPEYHYQAVNVEVQQKNPHSLLWWTKRLIDLRKRHPAFGRGSITFLTPHNHKVLAFIRSHADLPDAQRNGYGSAGPDDVLVVANLSRLTQCVELDLSAYQGYTPVELLGRTPFPEAGDHPYLLTLGPYAFYWFGLEKRHAPAAVGPTGSALRPAFVVEDRWDSVFHRTAKGLLEEWLPHYLPSCPWFPRRNFQVEAAMILETIPTVAASRIANAAADPSSFVYVALVQVEFSSGDSETYVLPLAFATGAAADAVRADRPQAVVAQLQVYPREGANREEEAAPAEGVLYDPLGEPAFARALLDAILRQRRYRRSAGELLAYPVGGRPDFQSGRGEEAGLKIRPTPSVAAEKATGEPPVAAQLRGELRNTSVVFGNRYILKVFRRAEEGVSPEVEVGRFLAEKTNFANAAPLAGVLEYRRGWGEPMTLAVLHAYVPHQADGWHFFQDALGRFFEQTLTRREHAEELPLPQQQLLDLLAVEVPRLAQDAIGTALETARLLGQRAAEMHLALASRPEEPAFAPEPFTSHYQRSLYQSLRSQIRQTFVLLRDDLSALPADLHGAAERLLGQEEALLDRARAIYEHKIRAQRIRSHGDFTLREVLYTGRDFAFIDFEGVPTRPLSDRRRKHTPLRDVAVMLRSFHYAVQAALENGNVRREDRPALLPWARLWQLWVSVAFLRGYWGTAATGNILPATLPEQEVLLDYYQIKRALQEVRYELARGRGRLGIPLQGLLQVLEAPAAFPPAAAPPAQVQGEKVVASSPAQGGEKS
jgi:maltose alpha-D-glucosyltransferase/alpha-amylase